MNQLVHQFDTMSGVSGPLEVIPDVRAEAFPNDDWFYESVTGGPSARSETGVTVNARTALSHGPVWQAVNLLMGDIGQLPLHKMIKRGRNREVDESHPVHRLFAQQPNRYQTPGVFKETMIAWMLLWGNGISLIDWSGSFGSEPEALIPLLPDRTGYIEDPFTVYKVWTWINHQYFVFEPQEVLHVQGFPGNGFWGQSAIDVARNVIGHGMALRKHGNATFKNGATPRGVLKHPGKLSAEARETLRNEWNRTYGGLDNASKIALLMEGMEFFPMSVNNHDAQWLEAAKLDREQVAALFNLPNHKLNALENAAVRANLEEQNKQYLQMSLTRWLNRFKEEIERKLLRPRERRNVGEHYMRWKTEAFLRGDTKARFESYGLAKSNRIMTTNEIRELEDMNPIEGGDELENPNIDTQESQQDNDDDQLTDDQEEAAQNVLRRQVEALLKQEENRVERGTAAKNFVSWLDEFYSDYEEFAEPFLAPAVNMLVVLGCSASWREPVKLHAELQKSRYLKLTDTVASGDKAGLRKAVAEMPLESGLAEKILNQGESHAG